MVTEEEYLKIKGMYESIPRNEDFQVGFDAFDAGVVTPTPEGYADPWIAYTESPIGQFWKAFLSSPLFDNPLSRTVVTLVEGANWFANVTTELHDKAPLILLGAGGLLGLLILYRVRPK
jgi:hypothetical protein